MTDGLNLDDAIAGAPVLFPAQLVVEVSRGRPWRGRRIHLARAQARRKSEPALVGVCPETNGVELQRARRLRWWRRQRWCESCKGYRDYLRSFGST